MCIRDRSNPEIHNIKEAYRRMYEALGTENVDTLFLPDPPPPVPTDPALENAGMLMGMPATAFPEQDHATHTEIHLAFVENKYVQANPATVSMIVSHVLQHVSLLAQGQAEQELQLQVQQNPELAMQMQQQEMMNQQAAAQGQPPMPNPMLENLKAQAELTLTQELMSRLDEILQAGQGDAIAKLKAQEETLIALFIKLVLANLPDKGCSAVILFIIWLIIRSTFFCAFFMIVLIYPLINFTCFFNAAAICSDDLSA